MNKAMETVLRLMKENGPVHFDGVKTRWERTGVKIKAPRHATIDALQAAGYLKWSHSGPILIYSAE